MDMLMMAHNPIHSWHDAVKFIVAAGGLSFLRIPMVLAKRVTLVSFQKREVRFKQK